MTNKFLSVWLFSHSHYHQGERSNFSGPVRYLLSYFLPKARYLVLHEQPMPSSDNLIPLLEIYKDQNLILRKQFFPALERLWTPRNLDPSRTYFRIKIRDVLSSLYFTPIILKHSPSFDIFIGVECLNAIFGYILKSLKLGKTVIYYLFDFAINRYSSRSVNSVYLWLDKQASYRSDATWNISKAIEEARLRSGYDRGKMKKQITVPYGIDFDYQKLTDISLSSGSTVLLAYAGAMVAANGVMILPQVIKLLKETCPRIKLIVMGGGEYTDAFLKKVDELEIKPEVDYKGYLPQETVWNNLTKCHIGLAPYAPYETTKMYGDVIKIKTYLSAGLPVITTSIPPISQDISRSRMGIVTEFNVDSLVKAISKIITDPEVHKSCRDNAIEYMKNQTWPRILDNALLETLNPIKPVQN